MKYALALIVIAGLALGTYWLAQDRPDCALVNTKNNECIGQINLEPIDCSKNVYSLEVCPPTKNITNLNELSY